MRELSEKSAVAIDQNTTGADVITEQISTLKKALDEIKEEMHDVMSVF